MRYDDWPGGTQRFFPNEMIHQALSVLGLLLVLALLVFWAPGPAEEPADPLHTPERIKPEWYFLPAYQFLKVLPSEFLAISLLGIFILALVLLPFLDRSKERDIRRRPLFLILSIAVVAGILALGIWGGLS